MQWDTFPHFWITFLQPLVAWLWTFPRTKVYNYLATSVFSLEFCRIQTFLLVLIGHKSARLGEILIPCHNFEIVSASLQCYQNNLFGRGHLLVPGHKCWRQSKNIVYIR